MHKFIEPYLSFVLPQELLNIGIRLVPDMPHYISCRNLRPILAQ